MFNLSEAEQILKLLQQTTTLTVVEDFLKSKKIPYSAGSWDTIFTSRIQPALERNEISNADLLELLKTAEECGRQHVFLYKAEPVWALTLIDERKIKTILSGLGLEKLLTVKPILEEPTVPTISDVRIEEGKLVIKIYEKKVYYELVSDNTNDGRRIVEYIATNKRAVCILRLHSSGILEIRINSHDSDKKYITEAKRMLRLVDKFFKLENFNAITLSKIKNKVANEQDTLNTIIKFNESILIDDEGYKLTATSGSGTEDIANSVGLKASVSAYIAHEAYCDSSNFSFKAQKDVPSKDIKVRLAGEVNEFSLSAHCSKTDYEYVLEQIIRINK